MAFEDAAFEHMVDRGDLAQQRERVRRGFWPKLRRVLAQLPDFIPVLGYTDDAAVLAAAIRLVAKHIRPEHRAAARSAIERGLRGA